MREFNIKDIVRLKGDMDTLYMVVDYMDFTEIAKNGKEIVDIDYELMQMYPIQKDSTVKTVRQTDIEIKDSVGSKNHGLFLKFVQKDRERRNWFGVPDFIRTAQNNLESIQRGTVKQVKAPSQKLDNIRYDILDSIDKCLDALNDLTTLHNMFGDDAYLQLKEVVTARLIKLSK